MEKIKELNRFVESIGIDVSKLTLDVFLYNKKIHHQFAAKKSAHLLAQKFLNR